MDQLGVVMGRSTFLDIVKALLALSGHEGVQVSGPAARLLQVACESLFRTHLQSLAIVAKNNTVQIEDVPKLSLTTHQRFQERPRIEYLRNKLQKKRPG
eukprot:6164718-Karenia_brevis.AAC.1